MNHILYKTTNLLNGKFYIGIHSTEDLNDGYLGSGTLLKQSIKKHGRENFKREILQTVDSLEELIELERSIVNEDFCKDRNNYNLEIGGSGGKVWTEEMKANMSESVSDTFKKGRTPWNKGKRTGPLSEAHKEKMSEVNTGKNNPMYGKSITESMSEDEVKTWKSKIASANKGKRRTTKAKDKISSYASNRIWMVNKEGKLTHTSDPNDPRLGTTEWQKGRIWKDID